jgi:beta-phosphoglucomutase-like phosphatase (HAD superfamily)
VQLIQELAVQGFAIGLGSSGPPENIESILGALGIRDYFGAVVSGRDVERGKPEPDVFLKAARKLGVEPGRCLVIEDVPAGVRAAHRAGMVCVALTTTHDDEALAEAERVVDDLRDFRAEQAAEMLS